MSTLIKFSVHFVHVLVTHLLEAMSQGALGPCLFDSSVNLQRLDSSQRAQWAPLTKLAGWVNLYSGFRPPPGSDVRGPPQHRRSASLLWTLLQGAAWEGPEPRSGLGLVA